MLLGFKNLCRYSLIEVYVCDYLCSPIKAKKQRKQLIFDCFGHIVVEYDKSQTLDFEERNEHEIIPKIATINLHKKLDLKFYEK